MRQSKLLKGALFHDPMLLIRLCLGIAFIWHGTPGIFSGDFMEGITSYMHMNGIPMPKLMAYLSQGTELLCGVLLLLGFWTRPAAFLLAINMAVAAIVVSTGEAGDLVNGELNLLYLIMAVALFLNGPTSLSLDKRI